MIDTEADHIFSESYKRSALLEARKELKIRNARENLIDFIEYMMPDPEYQNPEKDNYNPLQSLYDAQPHHRLISDLFVSTIRREELRAALSVPPQHGKTTICAQYGLAFYAAKNQEHKIIYGTYSDARASIVGESVRNIFTSQRFQDVFPEFNMRKGSKSKDLVGFGNDGSIMFIGRNSGASGNPCNFFVIDDPFKDRREARSAAIREEVWDWYCSVVEARCPATTPIFIIHTRWSEDDLIGRLCDKTHPLYNPEDADEFEYMNIPAIVTDPDMAEKLGIEPGSALWPGTEKKPVWPLWLLERARRKNPVTFSAIYMGNPVPPNGIFYTREMIKTYKTGEMPKDLKFYGASDHAVSEKQRADPSCIGIAGMDANGALWIHPDLVWKKIGPEKQVEEVARFVKEYAPLIWFSEGDHIKKTLGAFLKTALRKARLFKTLFKELPKNGDKQEKSQCALAMAQMGMLYFPIDAPWFPEALSQLLKFDGSEGRKDDFADFLATLCRGLDKMHRPNKPGEENVKSPETGSAAWVKMAAQRERQALSGKSNSAGW